MSADYSAYKIATFGCWNNYKFNNDKIPMETVTNYLKTVSSEYSDLIILGDNYYPQDKKKIMIGTQQVKKIVFNDKQFEDGFRMVESIPIPNKYLIMGNHDIEDTILDNCKGLIKELEKSDKFNIVFPFGSSNIITIGDTKYKYIFIDTSIYSLFTKGETCFDTVLKQSASEIMCKQNNFLKSELVDKSISEFLIFGHEPLISIKTKTDENGKMKHKQSLLNDYLLDILFSSNKKIKYICADVHMYQNCIITDNSGKEINQIVCGTGGADKDSYNNTIPIKKIDEKYNIRVINSIESYGYVEIILGPNESTANYIKINEDLTINRYSKKYYINYQL